VKPTTDHQLVAALRSLDGLSVGDAFGECFFSISLSELSLEMHLSTRTLPNHRWLWTDDTAMALSIVETLALHGEIDQDALASAFARRYDSEDNRGYGGTAHGVLRAIGAGEHWSTVSPAVLSGMGSMGNGSAMRVGPLGAYFAHDPKELITQAIRSAEVTHAHPEGKAGAVAAALAAGFFASHSESTGPDFHGAFFNYILEHTPDSQVRAGISQARDLPTDFSVDTAASVLGNGSRITAPDTVPYCLWCAARSAGSFEDAMWTTVSGGGDMDTNCAIVGGILAASEKGGPPVEWIAKREALPAFSMG
jgi:ADP-ribosylglycohydrolase